MNNTLNKRITTQVWVVNDNDNDRTYVFNTRSEARDFRNNMEGSFSSPRRYNATLKVS